MKQINTVDELNIALAETKGHLICQCPDDVYESTDHVRQSNLKEYRHSPAHYKASLNRTFSTDAMKLGTAVHIRVLYGKDAFDNDVIEQPKFNRRTKVGKEEFETWEKENKDKLSLDPSDYSKALLLSNNVLAHPKFSKMFEGGFAEVAVFTVVNGVPVKCKLDYYHPDKNLVVDLKTTKDTLNLFSSSVVRYCYDVQCASYTHLVELVTGNKPSFIFLVIEKSVPHGVKPFMLDSEWHEMGLNRYTKWLSQHKSCMERQHWQHYDPGIEVLSKPRWMTETR